ncbi:zinc finger protein BRUTUS-like [Citrus sinensis]|uniref:Zinc finger protein BRUTUS-like n=1 Tax=Citrus sinensis TaxID=2711 RepID=A0ACB8LRG6_CITSI|nr:zinc finger protein BRUTUS-like [Citrus sinensis]
MDGGDSTENAADKDEDEAPPLSESETFPGVGLVDAPILLLVYFHKAQRAELVELHRLAVTALERGFHDRKLILELQRRFEFLKVVYKYHCVAEDEVIFLALDAHIKNVVSTYSLEHESIDELFDSVFDLLNVLLGGSENVSKPFQEVVFCIGTIKTFICQHMLKEEEQVDIYFSTPLRASHEFCFLPSSNNLWFLTCVECNNILAVGMQVFPLLVRQFSSTEQASLVCQFLCSVPVLTSWLHSNSQPTFWDFFIKNEKIVQHLDGSANMKSIPKLLQSKSYSGENWDRKRVCGLHANVEQGPVSGLLPWHRIIRKDLEGILESLFQMKSSNAFSDLHSVAVQLKLLVDVLIFYGTALERFYYPGINELPSGCPARPKEQFHVEPLQQLLYHYFHNSNPPCKFVEKLICELESFVMDVRKQFAFQETECCSLEMQQHLLYRTLYMMPLGLLKCVITWFSAYLSEDESRSILYGINHGGPFINKSFTYLLQEWFRIGCSGKISVENFRMNLQKMFKSKCSFLCEKQAIEFSSLHPDVEACKGTKQGQTDPFFSDKDNKWYPYSSSSPFHTAKKYETSCSSGTSLLISFPQTIRTFDPLPRLSVEKSCSGSIIDEPIPMDLIFFFHKALKKDLDYLVFGSAQLAENALFLVEFHRRFNLIRLLYEIHSDAEDEIAFPAMEAKGKLQNISHSYSIDHRLEAEHFKKISNILIEMLELQASVSSNESNAQDKRMLKYKQLCIRLQDICKSMHKLLSEHIRREETELWPLFRECFSIEEQEKIIKCMLGRIRAETLQDMLPWLMASLTPREQNTMMSLWCSATKCTMFEEWLGEWWEGYDMTSARVESSVSPIFAGDPLEIISTYLSKEVPEEWNGESCNKGSNFTQNNYNGTDIGPLRKSSVGCKEQNFIEELSNYECSKCIKLCSDGDKKRSNEAVGLMAWIDKPGQNFPEKCRNHENILAVSQESLETAIRRVSRDSSLDPQKKSFIIQNLLMSRWITGQQMTHSKVTISSSGEEIPGQQPSYRDTEKLIFGCKHYKRNCKLVATCCNSLYTCIRCHDEVADHALDRVGKGLGIDYFHCMNCNACMSRSLQVHICREKSFMDNCPICHEDLFSSTNPAKALPCGHMMHSTCFQDYTCTHYTCPICSKSLGDMQVYFSMLDALLAEEKMPPEYLGQTQVILCNDCEKKGAASFHWLYHKCSFCGSYNTRLV